MSRRLELTLAWSAFGLSAGFATTGAVFGVLSTEISTGPERAYVVALGVLFLTFPVVGVLLVSRRAGGPLGWLLLGVALGVFVTFAASFYAEYALLDSPGAVPGGRYAVWISNWTWVFFLGFSGLFLLFFPDGRLPSPRWRWLVWLQCFAMAVSVPTGALSPKTYIGFPGATNPLGIERADRLLRALEWVSAFLFLAAALSVLALLLRYRRSDGEQRAQLKWMIAAGGAAALSLPVTEVVTRVIEALGAIEHGQAQEIQDTIFVAVWPGLPIAAGIAILKYRLYDIDIVINRSLVYGALTVFVLAVYAGLVAAAEAVSSRGGTATSLLAAVVVAVLFAPVKERIQRGVDRLLYGERRDPYRALSQLSARLEASLTLEDVLPAIVGAVAQSLRVPYVGVELLNEEGSHLAATFGTARGAEERVPLHYRGEPVGALAVGLRPGETEFSPADRKLLADLARQAGVAAHAVALTRALQRSRERLVTAREEERRRLRRDLHDGLGPVLAGITLQLDGTRKLLATEPRRARGTLMELRAHTQSAIEDIRRLVHDLRPPALDELGLLGALREHAARLDDRLRVTVDEPHDLPELPAAVEVAAYRIGLEALTNVVRHANAHNCAVRLVANGALELEISDDGSGVSPESRSGVGLGSMRERAAELGGPCTIEAGRGGGTRVRARLPLESA